MNNVTLDCVGKLFTNKKNSQMKFEFKKRELKKLGIKPEEITKLDISKLIKKDKNKFEDKFDLI